MTMKIRRIPVIMTMDGKKDGEFIGKGEKIAIPDGSHRLKDEEKCSRPGDGLCLRGQGRHNEKSR